MPTKVLANVYVKDGKNIEMPTTPGRRVAFMGGQARIVDHRDMPHMLGMAGAIVIPAEDALTWVPQWLEHTGQLKAHLELPEGFVVEHHNAEDWAVLFPDGTVQQSEHVSILGSPEEPKEPEGEPKEPEGEPKEPDEDEDEDSEGDEDSEKLPASLAALFETPAEEPEAPAKKTRGRKAAGWEPKDT